jgi:hypothetical protein
VAASFVYFEKPCIAFFLQDEISKNDAITRVFDARESAPDTRNFAFLRGAQKQRLRAGINLGWKRGARVTARSNRSHLTGVNLLLPG